MSRGWSRAKLGDVCRVVPGFAFKSSDWTDHGIPVVKIKNIRGDSSVDLTEVDCVPESLLTPKLQKFVLKDGDILVAMTGATAGKVGKLRAQRPVLLNQRVAKIEPVGAHPEFVWAIVSTEECQRTFFHLADGAAQPNMSGSQIEGVEVPLPPLPIQRRIGSILSAYDDLIDNNTRRITILEEMARALYREWFVHFRFPASAQATAGRPGHEQVKLVDSPLGKIPEGWEVVSFVEVADVLSGGTPSTKVSEYWDGSIPFFTPRDATYLFYVGETEKSITELGLENCSSQLYSKDTVFITARGTVGKVVMPPVAMAMNQSCYALRGNAGIDQLYVFLLTLDQVDYLKRNTGGATFDTIVVETFRRMRVVRPSIQLISDFAALVRPAFEFTQALAAKNTNLRATRDLLLPKLISGEIDVSALDIAAQEATA
ncbi:MAG TPA: restriction endonuclease subunit S [Candidatus Binatia bacterium]